MSWGAPRLFPIVEIMYTKNNGDSEERWTTLGADLLIPSNLFQQELRKQL